MKSYKVKRPRRTQLKINNTVQGEPLYKQLERMLNNGEPIQAFSPILAGFDEKATGVNPDTDIRVSKMDKMRDNRTEVHGKIFDLKSKKEQSQDTGTNPPE